MIMPPLDQNVWQERQRLSADMDTVTGITPYVTGSELNSSDSTATTTTTLSNAANQGLKFKAAQLHWKIFQRTFEMWGRMAQQFMTAPVYAKITGEQGSEWHAFTRDEIAGDFHYKLEGSEEAVSRQTERQESLSLLNTLTPYVQLGVVDPKPLIERVAVAFNILNPQELFKPPAPALPPAAPGLPPGVQTPVGGGNGGGPPPLMNGQPMSLPALMAVNSGGKTVG